MIVYLYNFNKLFYIKQIIFSYNDLNIFIILMVYKNYILKIFIYFTQDLFEKVVTIFLLIHQSIP